MLFQIQNPAEVTDICVRALVGSNEYSQIREKNLRICRNVAILSVQAVQILRRMAMATFALSQRQYYDRMNDLRSSGLIKRHKGKYDTTSFGQIFYSILKIAENATERHWKIQALDMMMNLPGNSLGVDYMKIIDIFF